MIAQAIGAGLQLANMGMSWQAQKAAEAKAAELDRQPVPQYTPDSRLNSFYQQAVAGVANPQGYTGAETAGYNSRLAQIMASRNANAQNMAGGQLSRAIGGMGNAEAINALNQFSGNDTALRRSAFNAAMGRQQSAMGQYQSLDNMNTQTALQRRLMKEQGLGQAIQSNKAMISNSLNNLGGDLMGYGMNKDLMAQRLAGTNPATTTGSPSADLARTYYGTGNNKLGLGNRFSNYANNAADNSGQSLTSQGAITNNQTFSLGNRNPAFSSAFNSPSILSGGRLARQGGIEGNPATSFGNNGFFNSMRNDVIPSSRSMYAQDIINNPIGRNYNRSYNEYNID